jgi:hypothetical protein
MAAEVVEAVEASMVEAESHAVLGLWMKAVSYEMD